jgi:hypothetical protein
MAGAMGFNAKMMSQQPNLPSTFGMEQDSADSAGQSSQQNLLYQQQ